MVHREVSEPFSLAEARLYVIPTGQSQPAFLLDSDEHPYLLLERTNDHVEFSAAALVVSGWCAPTDPSDSTRWRLQRAPVAPTCSCHRGHRRPRHRHGHAS